MELRCLMLVPAVETELWELHGGALIREALPVLVENGTATLGAVERVVTVEHAEYALRDGALARVTDPSRLDVEVTVRMSGMRREGDGIRVRDIRIAANGAGSFRFGNYYAKDVKILSVEVIEE